MSTASSPNQNSKTQPQIQSFIETLRQRGLYDFPQSVAPPFETLNQKKEIEQLRLAEFHRSRQTEWYSVYSKKDREKTETIEEIRQQLKALAKDVAKFNQNITQAVFTTTPNVGVYHQTFLEHIQSIIELIRHQVSEANSWISVYNKRQKSKGFYWSEAGKSGSSFMLNNERAVATSVG